MTTIATICLVLISQWRSGQEWISERLLKAKQVSSWYATHGLMYFDGNWFWNPAPNSLFPNIFSKKAFEYAKTIQLIWKKLVDKISRDREVVIKELEVVSSADPFTSRLIALYKTIPEEIIRNNLQVGIFRSDYMINENKSQVLQVEINTTAASLGILSKRVNEFRHFLLQRNPNDPEVLDYAQQLFDYQKAKLPAEVGNSLSLKTLEENIPANNSAFNFGKLLIQASRIYLEQQHFVHSQVMALHVCIFHLTM